MITSCPHFLLSTADEETPATVGWLEVVTGRSTAFELVKAPLTFELGTLLPLPLGVEIILNDVDYSYIVSANKTPWLGRNRKLTGFRTSAFIDRSAFLITPRVFPCVSLLDVAVVGVGLE